MGSSGSKATCITREMLEEYAQLTYLNKAEILHILNLFQSLTPTSAQVTTQNLDQLRVPAQDILKILPQLRYNPFKDSILRVFSSKKDGRMGFEDLLDLCSMLSAECPVDIKASWAFQIFDNDGDNQLSLDDLIKVVELLTGSEPNGRLRIDRSSAEFVAQVVLQELDLDQTGSIGPQEFIHTAVRMPEFVHSFTLKV